MSRERHEVVPVRPPERHAAIPTNVHRIRLIGRDLHVLGFRMPAFDRTGQDHRRATWDWILETSDTLLPLRSIISGDFNTPPQDRHVQELVARGWIRPEAGFGFVANNGAGHEIDHAFLSPRLALQMARASWGFQDRARVPHPHPRSRAGPGTPDHAALLIDFSADPRS